MNYKLAVVAMTPDVERRKVDHVCYEAVVFRLGLFRAQKKVLSTTRKSRKMDV